jgi:hypothetical protein
MVGAQLDISGERGSSYCTRPQGKCLSVLFLIATTRMIAAQTTDRWQLFSFWCLVSVNKDLDSTRVQQ